MDTPGDAGNQEGARQRSEASPPTSTRRRFVTMMGRLLLGLWGVGLFAGLVRYLRPAAGQHRRSELVIPAREVQNLAVGKAMLIAHGSQPIHLLRLGEREFLALSASCTHLRCVLEFDAADRVFICPCHDGQFDLNGNVLAGLPTVPLPSYRAAYRFGDVVIDLT